MSVDTLAEIKRHGLAIRQIPLEVHSTYDMRHFREGMERVKIGEREMARETRVPEHAGWWLCQKIRHTRATVQWSIKDDNLAPTLDESVAKFLEGLK